LNILHILIAVVTLSDEIHPSIMSSRQCHSPYGSDSGVEVDNDKMAKSAVLHRSLAAEFLTMVRAEGNHIILDDGRKIFDASGGAAVGCIGWGSKRVAEAVANQVLAAPYCSTIFYTTKVQEELCRMLVDSTGGAMSRAYIVNSGPHPPFLPTSLKTDDRQGSEAMEAALKLSRQYFLEVKPPQPQRTRFISRERSYHGITLGALAVGGHKFRRANFEPLLMKTVSQVSPCFEYRGKQPGESDEDYVQRLAQELDDEFQRVGPETVCAFVAEPVVGAVRSLDPYFGDFVLTRPPQALGCVPSVRGYFKAVQNVCQKYGALLILDEVMCGMGRTGTLHAWQQEDVVPDIQTIGKALGGGYQPIAGLLASHRVISAIEQGTS